LKPELLASVLLFAALGACASPHECEVPPEPPACDDGEEPWDQPASCGNGTVTDWVCVPAGIGDSCETAGDADQCGNGLLCVTEPDMPDAEFGTCLATCLSVEGGCETLGYEWECVTTSNGPDVCATDPAS
jgi:hypothetical protein